jgi:ubiquinone/menaquinone biosynthesis C-methylase UbiE
MARIREREARMSNPSGQPDPYGGVTADYYDAAYAVLRAPARDVEFYAELARDCGGPVLELACGTGRVLLEIAKQGIACTGVDLSPRMLERLREKGAPPSLRLVQARMQDFDLGQDRFNLIFAAFRGFQHLYTVEDQLACLARVRRHLSPQGAFAFDVFNPRLERMGGGQDPETEGVRFERNGEEVVRYEQVERDAGRQLLRVRMRYQRRRDGVDLGSQQVEIQMRWFYRYEIEHLLARAGFGTVEIYGDFARSPFGTGSPEIIAVARPGPPGV